MRSRLLVGPACLHLWTVVVMSPVAAAALKHFLALMQGKWIDLPLHSVPAAGPPTTAQGTLHSLTTANEQSICLRCIWVIPKLLQYLMSCLRHLASLHLNSFASSNNHIKSQISPHQNNLLQFNELLVISNKFYIIGPVIKLSGVK